MKETKNLDKFYDLISLYNLIIKSCYSKQKKYTIDIFDLKDNLYIKIFDNKDNTYVYNDCIPCSVDESYIIFNTISNEFVLNHRITMASFVKLGPEELFNYYKTMGKTDRLIVHNDSFYTKDNKEILIHKLVNSYFTLNIHYYNGLDKNALLIHQNALDNLCENNIEESNNLLKLTKKVI